MTDQHEPRTYSEPEPKLDVAVAAKRGNLTRECEE